MLEGKSREHKTDGAAPTRISALLGIALKYDPKASELCLTKFARTHFIGHQLALRVCGKKSCFDSQSEQAKKGKRMLQTLVEQESDNYFPTHSLSQSLSYQLVTYSPLIPHPPSTENPQHSFALPNRFFLSLLATLIRPEEPRLLYGNFSSHSSLPEGRFFDPIPT
jgi:hypothetical protein